MNQSCNPGTLVLTRAAVESLLDHEACIAAVEAAFRLHAEGRSLGPAVFGVRAPEGGFHVKAAGLELDRLVFAVKVNANFPANPTLHGLPAIRGVIVLCDGHDGAPLALMDSMELTARRTAAATAVAAKYLARPESARVALYGCGRQGREQLRSLARVLPLERVHAFDADRELAEAFARELTAELGIDVRPTADPAATTPGCDVCVTCTPARAPILWRGQVAPGTFVAAVGADAPDKQELDPRLMAEAKVVVDSLEQCTAFGDLHHAIAAGLIGAEAVHAELAEVVAGRRPGRCSASEIVVFDSTGTALSDVAAAALVYRRALEAGVGLYVDLAA